MSGSQPGIFNRQFREHLFVEYIVGQSRTEDTVQAAAREVASQATEKVHITIAFGPTLWAGQPEGFAFSPFNLKGLTASQGDLLLWIQGETRSDVYDAMRLAHQRLCHFGSVQLEVPGFVYRDFRDLSGFVDGIGNPKGDKAAKAALVPEGQPGAGGSFVLTQKWVHRLGDFHALSVSDQERVFGRTKADAIEFDEDKMPANAHVGRTDDPVMKIWRRSVPFASVEEQGLYFVAFSCEQARFDYLLKRMYGQDASGVVDRLTHFSTPVMNSYWFAPAQGWFGT
jgi:putative iron-dependent peroxidase